MKCLLLSVMTNDVDDTWHHYVGWLVHRKNC